MCFLQLFGSALQLTPHLHALLPEGLWGDDGEWVPLPPPEDDAVEAVLHRLLRQLRATFAALESPWPEEAEELLWAEAAQHRLPLELDAAPKKKARRLARALLLLTARGHGSARLRQGGAAAAVRVPITVSTALVGDWLTFFPLESEALRADARQASSLRVLGDDGVEAGVLEEFLLPSRRRRSRRQRLGCQHGVDVLDDARADSASIGGWA